MDRHIECASSANDEDLMPKSRLNSDTSSSYARRKTQEKPIMRVKVVRKEDYLTTIMDREERRRMTALGGTHPLEGGEENY